MNLQELLTKANQAKKEAIQKLVYEIKANKHRALDNLRIKTETDLKKEIGLAFEITSKYDRENSTIILELKSKV